MFFGLATFGMYTYILSNVDNLSMKEGKNFLLIMPIIGIFALMELFAEIKYGFKEIPKAIYKGIKKIRYKIKVKKIRKKVKQNKILTEKEQQFVKKENICL